MPKRRKGSPYYWYDFTVSGIRFRGSCETDKLETAKAIEAKLRTEALLETKLGTRREITLNAAAARYWEETLQHQAWGEISAKYTVRELLQRLGKNTRLSDINENKVARLVAKLRGAGNSNATVNRKLAVLRGIMKRMDKLGFAVAKVDFTHHTLIEPEARVRWETPEAIDRLIAASPPYLQEIIMFALYTGVRKSNVLSCKHEQINLAEGYITFKVKSKLPGRKTLLIPIADGLSDLLVTRLGHETGKTGYLFRDDHGVFRHLGDIKKAWKSACKKAEISDYRFHDLRHTAASWLVQRGVPIVIVKEILGHRDIATTMKYVHLAPDQPKEAISMHLTAQLRHIQEKHLSDDSANSLEDNGASDRDRTGDLKSHNLKGNKRKSINNNRLKRRKA